MSYPEEGIERLLEKAKEAYGAFEWNNKTLPFSILPCVGAKTAKGSRILITEFQHIPHYMMNIHRPSLKVIATSWEDDINVLYSKALKSMRSKIESQAEDHRKLVMEFEELVDVSHAVSR